jgi:hypothetical protein
MATREPIGAVAGASMVVAASAATGINANTTRPQASMRRIMTSSF